MMSIPDSVIRELENDDALEKLESAVVEAALLRRRLQTQGHARIANHLPTDHNLGLCYFTACQAETEAIDALIAKIDEA